MANGLKMLKDKVRLKFINVRGTMGASSRKK